MSAVRKLGDSNKSIDSQIGSPKVRKSSKESMFSRQSVKLKKEISPGKTSNNDLNDTKKDTFAGTARIHHKNNKNLLIIQEDIINAI